MRGLGQTGRWLRGNWRRLALVVTLGSATAVAYAIGRSGVATPEASAVPPRPSAVQTPSQPSAASAARTEATDLSANRIVAAFGDNMQLTRQDFGEYLIARQTKRLDQFVNKRIIEHYCLQHGVSVSDAEIDAQILKDLGKMNITPKLLLDQILSRYNMSFYEWREDVVRPQLMMKKVVENMVSVSADDLKKAYEAEYGEKRRCRIIIWRAGMEERNLYEIYAKIRKDDAEFERAAKTQADAGLAACGGRLNQPVSRYSMAKPEIEDRVFRLREGEITEIMEDNGNKVVFKCDEVIPPDPNAPSLESVRNRYIPIILESKIRDEIPKVCRELREQANVHTYLMTPEAEKEWLVRAEQELQLQKAQAAEQKGSR
jgi:hypothetical protein